MNPYELTVAANHLQVMANMAEAMATVSASSTALTASIRQAASWLGHHQAQSATPAQQQQVSRLSAVVCFILAIVEDFSMRHGGCT